MHKQEIADRFWSRVERSGGPDACWPFLGARHERGYGQIKIGGRLRRAHQVAWELHNAAPFPKPLIGLHSCHNPNCVNPSHIRPGTAAENYEDAVRRGTLKRRQAPLRAHYRRLKDGTPPNCCKSGHPVTPENSMFDKNGHRRCRVCARQNAREFYRRRHCAADREAA